MPVLSRVLVVTSFALVSLCPAVTGCEDRDKPRPADDGADAGPRKTVRADEGDTATGDLSARRDEGTIRFLVFGSADQDYLPRDGSPVADEWTWCEEFAASLSLRPVFVTVDRFDQLLPALLEGRGDIAAARITVTDERKQKVAFTRPVQVVDETVVGRKNAPDLPRRPKDLAGRKVLVRPTSSYAETLQALNRTLTAAGRPPIQLVTASEQDHNEQLLHRVATGEADLTVVDSDQLAAAVQYEKRIKGLFPVDQGRQIAWGVRPDNPALLAAANAFVLQRALTGHTRETFTGDLDGIQKRKVLRVLTRNNGVTYYLHRGVQMGFAYELAKLVAADLGVRLEVVVPPRAADLVPWLQKGRGDVIAASFTVTDARAQEVAFTTPYLFVDQVLVGKKGAAGNPTTLAALKGKTIHVRRSSSYWATLQKLAANHGPFNIVAAKETVETEELLAQVADGTIPFTVADSHILAVEQTLRDELVGLVRLTHAEKGATDPLGKPREEALPIAFAVRPTSTKLQARLNAWVQKHYRGLAYNVLKRKYFEDAPEVATRSAERQAEDGTLSPYDAIIQKYAKRYGLDWRLMAAQAYQESRFDPDAKSWVGAIGLFQVMPRTGAELGFTDLKDPDKGTHAGIKYMHQLIDRFEDTLPVKERVRFALASYNAGRGHVIDARRLAAQKGWDDDRWFGHVEKAMLLLKQPRYARKARHGYCRGDEPVQYVSKIQSRYDAYTTLVGEQ